MSPSRLRTRAGPPDATPQPPRIGERLAALRERQALSMDDLSRRAGVSKSMLSQIERAQANPTVAVVWRLAQALGVALTDLLEDSPSASRALIAVIPAHGTPTLQSGEGRWELRVLGPIELAGRMEWYELRMQPGAEMRSQAHEPGAREHLTVVSGALEVVSGAQSARLRTGETARYAADVDHAIVNGGRHQATAWLVVEHAA